MNQVLVKKPILHGHISGMVRADVIASKDQMLTVRIGKETMVIPQNQTVPLRGPKSSEVKKMASPARAPLTKF